MIIETLKIILPLLVAFSIGILCRKKGIVSNEGNFCLKDLLSNIIFPAVLFNSFLFAKYDYNSIIYVIVAFALFTVTFILLKLSNYKVKGYEKYSQVVATTWEGGSVGVSFVNILFGMSGITTMALLDLGQGFFVFGIIVPYLKIIDGGKTNAKNVFKIILSNRTFDAIILGLILGLLDFDKILMAHSGLYGIYTSIQNILSSPLSFLLMFTIGYDLVIKRELMIPVLKTVLCRLIIFGIMCLASLYVIFKFVPYDRQILLIVILAYSLPTSYALPTFSRFEGSREYLSTVLSVTTVITLISFTIISLIR